MNYPICWPGTKIVKSSGNGFDWRDGDMHEATSDLRRTRITPPKPGRLLDSAGRTGVVTLRPRNINAISIDPHPLKSAGKTARLKGKT